MPRMLIALLACVIVVALAVAVGEILGERRDRSREHENGDDGR